MLAKCKECFDFTPGLCTIGVCEIETVPNAPVVNQPPYQVPLKLKKLVDEELDRLIESEIIVPSDSYWASPLVPIRKPDGSIRICVDFRRLNSITPLKRFYMPTLPEILDSLGSSCVLSKVDLVSGFHQIQMSEESSPKTTFVCHKGKFRYLRMPFGLRNAPSIFQSVMEAVLSPVRSCSRVYIDDVVVFSPTWEAHLNDLCKVLMCMKEAGYQSLKLECCR